MSRGDRLIEMNSTRSMIRQLTLGGKHSLCLNSRRHFILQAISVANLSYMKPQIEIYFLELQALECIPYGD